MRCCGVRRAIRGVVVHLAAAAKASAARPLVAIVAHIRVVAIFATGRRLRAGALAEQGIACRVLVDEVALASGTRDEGCVPHSFDSRWGADERGRRGRIETGHMGDGVH